MKTPGFPIPTHRGPGSVLEPGDNGLREGPEVSWEAILVAVAMTMVITVERVWY